MRQTCLVLALIICSCTVNNAQKKAQAPCYQNFKTDTKKYWRYDALGKCYITDEVFFTFLVRKYSKCLDGVDTSLIYETLGREMTKIVDFENKQYKCQSIVYRSQWDMADEKPHWVLYIDFNKKGKLINIRGNYSTSKSYE